MAALRNPGSLANRFLVAAYADEDVMTEGAVDPAKVRPFVLTTPDRNYWALGDLVGKAWSIGAPLKKS